MYDIEVMPYWCDDCEAWEKSLWSYDDETGEPIQGDESGNWEPQDEYPEPEEFVKAWAQYYEWVAENGQDPLDEFTSPHVRPRRVTATYEFRVGNSILGPILIEWRKGTRGEWKPPAEAPNTLKDYLNLQPGHRAVLGDFAIRVGEDGRAVRDPDAGMEGLLRIATDVEWRGKTSARPTGRVKIDETVARTGPGLEKALRAEARKALREKRKDYPSLFPKGRR